MRPPSRTSRKRKRSGREGFDFFKLKIGVKPIAAEIAAAHAIRAALPDSMLCADANCGLTLAAARRYAERTRDANLAFIEQPLPADDLAGLKALARATKTPIGMDESIQSLADIEAVRRAGAKGVSLKLIKLGGFRAAIAAGKLCKKLGLKINVAAKIAETSIGTAAAVHLACAVPNVDWGVSLTNLYLAEDIVRRPIALRDGFVALPEGPGLGVEVDEAAVARFRVTLMLRSERSVSKRDGSRDCALREHRAASGAVNWIECCVRSGALICALSPRPPPRRSNRCAAAR